MNNNENMTVQTPNQIIEQQESDIAVDAAMPDIADADDDIITTIVSNYAPVSWDLDNIIEDITAEYIRLLKDPRSLSNKELKNGCMCAINEVIRTGNTLLAKGDRIRKLHNLPNYTISRLMQAKYHIKAISWTGQRDEKNLIGIYMEDGPKEGIYCTSYTVIGALIKEFKTAATKIDIDWIIEDFMETAEIVKVSNDPDLLAFNNGIFNYKTKQLLPFTPDIIFTRKSNVNYVTGGIPVNKKILMPNGEYWDVESWMESLSDDPELVNLFWLVIGAVLRPNVRWDKIVCMYSTVGMNGKGCLCKLMMNICGEGFYASIPIAEFAKDAKVAQLLTANAVITDENATNKYAENVANLKALTTGDHISIDRKFQSALTFAFSGLIVQCVNELPRAADQTDSYYRRFLMIPFEKTFKGEENKDIKNVYLADPEVLEYVVWKVMNLPDYYEFPEPDACKLLLDDYKQYNDPVMQFVDEIFPELAWEKVPLRFINDLYSKWCAKNNPSGKIAGKRRVLDRIKDIVKSKYSDEWEYIDGVSTRINDGENEKPELLIAEYGMDDWHHSKYKGTNPEQYSVYDPSKPGLGGFKRYFLKKSGNTGAEVSENA